MTEALIQARHRWPLLSAWPAILVVALVVATGFQKVHNVAAGVRSVGVRHVAAGSNNLADDFALSVWIPTRALEQRLDPYNSTSMQVRRRFGNDEPAALYVPAILALLAPVTVLRLPEAAEAMAALTVACLWFSLWLLIKPRRRRDWALLAGLGFATLYGYASENTLLLGQPTGLFVLGLALVARAIMLDSFGPAALVGTSLLLLKPQYAIPTLAFLALLRQWRIIALAVAVVAVASVPFAILEVRAAGGPINAVRVIGGNLRFFQHLDSQWGRTDVATLITGGSPSALGAVGAAALFIVLLLMVAFGTMRRGIDSAGARIGLVAVLAGFTLASIFHPAYDTLILVVPVALVLCTGPSVSSLPLTVFASIYVLMNFASRASFRYRIGGVYESAMHDIWPPVISLAALAVGMGVVLGILRPRDTLVTGRRAHH